MSKTKISSRGQTVIPKEIRKQYRLREGIHIEWVPFGEDSFIARTPSTRKKSRSNIQAIRRKLAPYIKGAQAVADIRSIREES